MPNIELIVKNPQTTFSDTEYGGVEGWRLTFDANLSGLLQRVELTTSEGDMRDLEGTVAFEPILKEADGSFEKGSLTYWKASSDELHPTPPNYLVTLRLADQDLERLIRTIADGSPLASVNIEVDDPEGGFERGREPDGSQKKWNNATRPQLDVKGYRLFFGKPEDKESEEKINDPSIKSDSELILAMKEDRKVSRYVNIAIVLILLLAFLLD